VRRAGEQVVDDLADLALTACLLAARGVLRLAWALVVLAWQAPRTVLLLGGHGLVLHLWGRQALAATVVMLAILLLAWRLSWPTSFARYPGRWWAGWWRRWLVYRWWWPFLAARHGLTAGHGLAARTHTLLGPYDPATGRLRPTRPDLVKLRRVDVAPGTDRLLLALPAGAEPDDLTRQADALAHGLGALTVRVRPARPGRVWLDVVRRDTLTTPVPPLPVPAARTPEQVEALLAGVPVGRCEDHTPWRLRLSGTHVLVAGATGAGKGSVQWATVRGLTAAVTARLVEVVVFDPKGGMEFAPGAPLFAALHTDDVTSMADALDDLVGEMDARAKALAGHTRRHTPAPGSPHRVVVIDELATLVALADPKTTRRIENALGLLLSKARATGITVLASVIDPAKDVIRWRNLFPTRVALRLDEATQVDMVLGPGARDRGAHADTIPLTTPGVGYVRLDTDPAPTRVRASLIDDAAIADLVRAHVPRPRVADDDTANDASTDGADT
jgi:S-DNA-T family DNA segregation ATPase FtsK/SpoIIIE